MTISAVIVGAGAGRRVGGRRKAMIPLAARPMVLWSLEAFARVPEVREVVLVLDRRDAVRLMRRWPAELRRARVKRIVPGGRERYESSRRGILFTDPACDVVLVHDAARPFVTPALVRRVARAARRAGAAIPVVRLSDTIKRVRRSRRGAWIIGTEDRDALAAAQTPQGLSMRVVMELAQRRVWTAPVTDEAQWVERLGRRVAAVEGDAANFKITTPADLRRAQEIAARGR
jgi:2-C-methyl-D-erythritol 4-phosphate cytidylyltransferase